MGRQAGNGDIVEGVLRVARPAAISQKFHEFTILVAATLFVIVRHSGAARVAFRSEHDEFKGSRV
eukprot:CAMPEP_0180440440 /NCGR_PEP_ID=MMETSP1036_2-20121128/13109_1 /TAXON_ID=632150 /ORGANISM="Azadinium spinosum, Strain 3D9" /LENGTH=64 /DNA_ID=CAMNT_0022446619 /DNA_START=1079 /DNA_END=1273 /DNA_ORIENTATION=-